MTAAIAAPSKGNSQIWEFVVVTGNRKNALDEMLVSLLRTEFIPSMKLSEADDGRPSEALERSQRRMSQHERELSAILSPLGLSVETFMLEGTFTFFHAPVAILVFVDEVFARDLPHILCVGAAVQNMLLEATALGIGTCWIGGVWRYTREIRALLNVAETKRLLSSVAVGYPDFNSPLGEYKSSRDDVGEFVRWIEDEE